MRNEEMTADLSADWKSQPVQPPQLAITLLWEWQCMPRPEIIRLDEEARTVLSEWLNSVGHLSHEFLPSRAELPAFQPGANITYVVPCTTLTIKITPDLGFEDAALNIKGMLMQLIEKGISATQTYQGRALVEKVLHRAGHTTTPAVFRDARSEILHGGK